MILHLGFAALTMSKVCLALMSVLSLCFGLAISPAPDALQGGTLCERGEKIVFSCTVKPAKIVSLCSSKELTKDRGYLKYRFGLPSKIELEYPKEQKLAREAFKYTHYFRYQVDYTSISFALDGHEYMVWDDYNGEEKYSAEGLTITPPGRKEVTLKCRGRAKAQYGDLPDAFPDHEWFPKP